MIYLITPPLIIFLWRTVDISPPDDVTPDIAFILKSRHFLQICRYWLFQHFQGYTICIMIILFMSGSSLLFPLFNFPRWPSLLIIKTKICHIFKNLNLLKLREFVVGKKRGLRIRIFFQQCCGSRLWIVIILGAFYGPWIWIRIVIS